VRRLPSQRFQAIYTGPDLARYRAPGTFVSRLDAEAWLMRVRDAMANGTWTAAQAPEDLQPSAPAPEAPSFGEYATAWLAGRDLKPRTRQHYQQLLDSRLLPVFAERRLDAVTPAQVRLWHADLDAKHPTMRAHAYALLRTIYTTAVADDLVAANPCRVRAAGSSQRIKVIKPATLAELEVAVAAMPERLRPMVLIAAWCTSRHRHRVVLHRRLSCRSDTGDTSQGV